MDYRIKRWDNETQEEARELQEKFRFSEHKLSALSILYVKLAAENGFEKPIPENRIRELIGEDKRFLSELWKLRGDPIKALENCDLLEPCSC